MDLIDYLKNYFSKKEQEKEGIIPKRDSSSERESFIADIKPHTGKLYPLGHASDIYLKNGSIFTVVNTGYTIADMIA